MEHRLDARVQAPIDVNLHTDNGDIVQTRAKNLSRGGMHVEIGHAKSTATVP